MAQKIPNSPRLRAAKRPLQDINMAKKAANYPAVGMTLSSYQYDSRDRSRRLPGRPPSVKGSRLQKLKQNITLKRAVVSLAVTILLIGGFLGGKFAYNAQKLFGGNIFGILSSTKLKGEDQGRVNILLAGNSADDVGHNGGQLTDSIMLISLDTKNNKGFLLSIPRDLWVNVSGEGHGKINTAYVTGEANNFDEDGYPKGGMGQLEQVISENLDLPIQYYALVNYNALKQAVDAVGGIDFRVQSQDPRGLYDPNTDYSTRAHGPLVKLTNGVHHLNGQQSLNLARARGDAYNSYGFEGSDFTRTENQRKLLIALKSKAVSAGTLSNPAKLSNLADAIGNNVKTDLKLSEVRRLYDLSKQIQNSRVQSLSLNDANGKSLLQGYSSPNGQSALVPAAGLDDFSDIQTFIRQKTSSNALVQEAGRVVVLNGTTTNGLASKVRGQLKAKRLNVTDIGDAGNSAQMTTAIINLSGTSKPATGKALVKLFGNHVTTQNPYGKLYDADYIIVLGKDKAHGLSSTSQ